MRHHSIKDAHIEEIACIDPLQPRAYIIPFGGTLVDNITQMIPPVALK